MRGTLFRVLVWTLFTCAWIGLQPQAAQAAAGLQINIYGPGQSKVNTYLAPARELTGKNATLPARVHRLQDVVQEDLAFLPFLHFVPAGDILGGPTVRDVTRAGLDFKRFRMSKVDLLCTIGWSANEQGRINVEMRAFDVYTGRMLLGRGYVLRTEAHVIQASSRFCAGVMQELTGRSGFFSSELAFVRKSSKDKDIYVCTPQGHSLHSVVDMDGFCLSPAWSWDGKKLALSFVGQDRHELVVWDRTTGSLQHAVLPGNTVISPAFWPGHGLVVSVDPHKSPDIYTVTDDLRLGKPLVQDWSIDISPDFDAQGKFMVFVSSRFGNPHIFLRHMDSGRVERISFDGKYNTNPSISPDGRFVAYSRRIEGQGHRIIVYDRQTQTERQVSFGPGNDEDPAWGPDSYFLAFTSSRSGTYKLYVTTRHADEAKKIPTGQGAAMSPAWRMGVENRR